jgi:CheY-like chemotaxis protein
MARHPVILVVDDDMGDRMLAQRAFLKAKLLNPVLSVNSGEQAISYLNGQGIYADREKYPLPSLILLDLDMPTVDGFEVLRWIRDQPKFKSLRVVVLTGSDSLHDVNAAYQAGANSFMIKPVDFERFAEA